MANRTVSVHHILKKCVFLSIKHIMLKLNKKQLGMTEIPLQGTDGKGAQCQIHLKDEKVYLP